MMGKLRSSEDKHLSVVTLRINNRGSNGIKTSVSPPCCANHMPLMARSHIKKISKTILLPQLPLSWSRWLWFLTRNTATFYTKECSAHVFLWQFYGFWSIYVFNPFYFCILSSAVEVLLLSPPRLTITYGENTGALVPSL